jgi:ornithine carbamoyltransferase
LWTDFNIKKIFMNYLKDSDFTPKQIKEILALSVKVKTEPKVFSQVLKGKTVALLFEKASLRTKFTLQIGIEQLGGYSVLNDGKIPDREPIADIARNLERWVDLVVARVYAHATLEELAKNCSKPVVNALSDMYHPCQILADMLTLQERFGSLKGIKLAFVGDGNNVCNSLILTGMALGLDMRVVTPKKYEPHQDIIIHARKLKAHSQGKLFITSNIRQAVKGADVIYTDTWVSMGQEAEADVRRKAFKGFQVTETMFKLAKKSAVFMHCLPKHPNEEVADEVFESTRSLVFEQAENRLHTIKGLLIYLASFKD